MKTFEIVITVAVVILFVKWVYSRIEISLKDDEFLRFLSYTQWKSGRRITKEICSGYRGTFSYIKTYQTLQRLREQGHVERRIRNIMENGVPVEVHEFRKLHSGGPRNKKDRRKIVVKRRLFSFQPA